MRKVEDVDFNPDDFVARVNTDLVGKYVNIASRAVKFVPGGKLVRRDLARWTPAGSLAGSVRACTRRAIRQGAARGDGLADQVNLRFDGAAPWKLVKEGKAEEAAGSAPNAWRPSRC